MGDFINFMSFLVIACVIILSIYFSPPLVFDIPEENYEFVDSEDDRYYIDCNGDGEIDVSKKYIRRDTNMNNRKIDGGDIIKYCIKNQNTYTDIDNYVDAENYKIYNSLEVFNEGDTV